MWTSCSRTIDLRLAFTSNLTTVCLHFNNSYLYHTLLLSGASTAASLTTCFKIISIISPQLLSAVDTPVIVSVNNWTVQQPPIEIISHPTTNLSVPSQPSGISETLRTSTSWQRHPFMPKIVYCRPLNRNIRTWPIQPPANLVSVKKRCPTCLIFLSQPDFRGSHHSQNVIAQTPLQPY